MCTLSWKWSEETFHLFFNRDEALSRPEALSPQIQTTLPTNILCPVDPQGGGTWLGVNQYGLVMALVNDYQDNLPNTSSPYRSRGRLVMEMLELSSMDKVIEAMHKMDQSVYAGYLLHVFSLNQSGVQFHWNGKFLQHSDLTSGTMPISSSSIYPDEAKAYREQHFSSKFNISEIRDFHALFDKDQPALSPWMIRDDAKTQSYTEVLLTQHEATMRYGTSVSQAMNQDGVVLKQHG